MNVLEAMEKLRKPKKQRERNRQPVNIKAEYHDRLRALKERSQVSIEALVHIGIDLLFEKLEEEKREEENKEFVHETHIQSAQ